MQATPSEIRPEGAPQHEAPPAPEVLWKPTNEQIRTSNLGRFMDFLNDRRGLTFADYDSLHSWSVRQLEDFWADLSAFSGVKFHTPAERVLGSRKMPGADWFPGATLNYAEHILTDGPGRGADDVAAVFCREDGQEITLTHGDLRVQVGRARAGLQRLGVGVGDRVVALAPNAAETMIFFLAAASLGATWSCCSPDFGAQAVRDRFSQIEPVVMLAFDGYQYGGKTYDTTAAVAELSEQLPTLRATVLVSYVDAESVVPGTISWTDFVAVDGTLEFEPVPFSHPLWILYSSGTTGLPKAIVHSHGGIILDHIKALGLHLDLRPGDRLMWYSTTGWMMWNYVLSAMLVGASLVIYDGNPGYPNAEVQWKLVERHRVNFFGMSAAFIHASMKEGILPRERFNLSSLKAIGSTGSPLSVDGYHWLHDAVSPDLPICSISGGTDLCAAFIGPAPTVPVWSGELSRAWLGAAVAAFDPDGRELHEEIGELVLTEPMPSMPVSLWGDDDGTRMQETYFDTYPGVWHHGDSIRRTIRGSWVISGRSDATLNRGGVRMGTADFYAVVEAFDEILDSMVIEIGSGDGRLLCFVVLAQGTSLDEIEPRLRRTLREKISPRHVPDVFYAVPAIPRTLTGKKTEVPVRKILAGVDPELAVKADALADPRALEPFMRLAQELPKPPQR
ncbi:acetoacetate--CoA ligase [Arthrobacter ramosus]|uniref:Acetoacetate--CoA ligase n=1 Tax=Arthrobacter ramosus TaxID=1672 RepID=A0ABV5Y4P2_ARTRM|nr:acetoacetate--CoA ligase [Arthrobacter ramosus]